MNELAYQGGSYECSSQIRFSTLLYKLIKMLKCKLIMWRGPCVQHI